MIWPFLRQSTRECKNIRATSNHQFCNRSIQQGHHEHQTKNEINHMVCHMSHIEQGVTKLQESNDTQDGC